MAKQLNMRQERFCQELLKGRSQREAYRAAGYSNKMSDKSTDTKASKLFNTPEVQLRYDELRKRLTKETEEEAITTAKEVLQELANIAFANGADFASVGENQSFKVKEMEEIPEAKRAAIAGIKKGTNGIEIKTYDKVKALELLGKHLGVFAEKIKLEGKMDHEISMEIMEAMLKAAGYEKR